MTWIQKLAWEEAFALLERCKKKPGQLKKMGFSCLGDAAVFEYRRVARLAQTE